MVNSAATKATTREWLGLAILTVPILLVAMDISVLYLALPALVDDLRSSNVQTLWILDIYGFFLAGLLITMGSLGDRIGRRKLLLIGAGVFGLASLLAAFAWTPILLVIARAFLGIGGATLAPSTLSLIRNMFHQPHQRRVAIGVWTAGFSGGSALGPVIGGFLLEHFWWGSVFLINVPFMIIVLVAVPCLVPEFVDRAAPRLDLVSLVVSIVAMLGLVFAVKQGAEHGVTLLAGISAVVGLVCVVWFSRRQRKLSDPLIDMSLFQSGAFTAAVLAQFIVIFALAGFSLFTSQYLQLISGYRPFEAGVWLVIPAAAAAVGAIVATPLSHNFSIRAVIVGGLLFVVLGTLVLAFVKVDSVTGLLILGMSLLTSGVGAAATLNSDIVLTAAAPEKAGTASAVSETGAELGGAMGIAILGTISGAIYRHTMVSDMPEGVPAEVSASATKNLGSALSAAETMPASVGESIRTLAASGFVDGVAYTAAGTAIGVGLCSVVIFRMLRASPSERAAVEGPDVESRSGRG
ncbi:MFS transporter [Rhodococcoides fascians]|uniref:MFS transporter n=1 Tax=Rhodococcoides fascians TaxID=1828 RepID=UPI00068A3DBE|nr:MFS transporter [Rhodococcus fascians]